MRILTLILILLFLQTGQVVQGIVYHDKNKNSQRDKDEVGLAGVAVSDQVQVVLTDSNGHYEIQSLNNKSFVIVSLPEGYTTKSWWQKISTHNDFALVSTPVKSSFSFIHASDTHISEKSLDRMEKLRALVSQLQPDFVLVTGDLVKDALRVSEKEATGYFDLYTRELTKFTVPVWSVPGNHEIFGIERHLSLVSKAHPLYGKKMYHQYLGPNYYSFNFGGLHFIGLDNVDFEDLWYYGHIDSVQLKWLKADLAHVPATTPVIPFGHIPFYSGGLSMTSFTEEGPSRTLERESGKLQFRHVVSNAKEVIDVLKSHPLPLVLTGHYHARQVFWYETSEQKTRYEQTGAVVEANRHGDELLPSGVTLYKVTNGKLDEGRFIPLDQ